MKQTLLLALFAFSLFAYLPEVHAQAYRPGFIVKAEGDTIRGLVKYKEGKSRYTSCTFKTDENAAAQKFTPEDIMAYSIVNEGLFESRQITNHENIQIKTFAEVLTHGKLSLYEYRNMLYLAKDNGDLQRVAARSNEPGTTGIPGEQQVKTTSTGHLILINTLTYDCPVPEELLTKVLRKISAPNMLAIVDAYNNCQAPNSSKTYKQEKPWLAIEKGVLVGAHSTKIGFTAGPYAIKDVDFAAKTNLIVGGHLNFMSPKRSEKISIQLDAFFSKESYEGYLEQPEPLIFKRNYYTIDFSRVSAVAMARYTVANHKRLSPYVAAGVSGNFIISEDAGIVQRKETTINDVKYESTETSDAYLDMTYYAGLTAALGTSYTLSSKQMLLLQVRAEQGVGTKSSAYAEKRLSLYPEQNPSFYLSVAYVFK